MNIPENLRYTKSHEWVETLPDGIYRVGITDFAQSQLGDIVFITLPEAGETVTPGERMADLESVKAVTDIFSPFSGKIRRVNEALEGAPEEINSAPYEAWICEIENIQDEAELLTAAEYRALAEEEGA